jgi:hypothetical protein
VIRNDDDGAAEVPEMVATHGARVAKNLGSGPDERVVDKKSKPTDGFALSPAGIAVFHSGFLGGVGAFCHRLGDELLQVGEGSCLGESGFVEFEVVTVFEGGEEFDTVQRGEGG